MGEIADALKKSQVDAGANRGTDPPAPQPERDPSSHPGPHAEAQRRSLGTADAVDAPSTEAPPIQPADFPAEHVDVEAHRHLAVRIRAALESRSARTVAVVSGLRNEGKTTVTCNLASAMASMASEREVAIIDLDLRNPTLHRWLGVKPEIGLESFLLGDVKLSDVCIRLSDPNLDVFPALLPQRAAHELLVTPLFEELIRQLESRYRTVVIDTPPCLTVPDAVLIMRQVATCTLVARVGESRLHRLQDAIEQLPAERQLGTVLNCSPTPSHRKEYDYYYGRQTGEDADPSQES